MTDDTKNCDVVSEYLENTYPEFKGSILVIHTKTTVKYLNLIQKKTKTN
jgi:hypothetical protein